MSKAKEFEANALPELENLYRTALFVSNTDVDAQDLIGKTIVQAYISWHECGSRLNCRVWLYRIMANIFITKCQPTCGRSAVANGADKSIGYLVQSMFVNQQPADYSEQDSFSAISTKDVKNAIGNLPNDIRLVVVLSLLESFTYQEIAEIAGLQMQSVKSKLRLGRQLIKGNFSTMWRAKATSMCPQAESGGEIRVCDQSFS